MPTVSLCMIVKNEEAVLARCLDSLNGLMDEIIIVDTGSTDSTKDIAGLYTDKVYDYEWTDDFAAARNFSFSLATMDYIYAPDADEVLDDINRMRFEQLKAALLPEVEIVQMKYHTVTGFDTVLNSKTEYRPKLFRRLRTFTWIDPIHETVRTSPVVYDSDIEILHMPQSMHSKRDFSIFLKAYKRDGMLSPRICNMYARELIKGGDENDFKDALPVFLQLYECTESEDARKEYACVLAHAYRLMHEPDFFFKYALKDMVTSACSEMCYEIGLYYEAEADYNEAVVWFINAYSETDSILDIHTGGDLALTHLVSCYDNIINTLEASDGDYDYELIAAYRTERDQYKSALDNWTLPNELA